MITDIVKRAIAEFGITTNQYEAGYILNDGIMLDFSGKRDGGESGVRCMDHREVSFLYDDLQQTEAINQFMIDTGAIRVSVNKDDLIMDIAGNNPLTEQQILKVKQLSARKNTVIIDYYQDAKQYSPIFSKVFDFPQTRDVDNVIKEIQSSYSGRF